MRLVDAQGEVYYRVRYRREGKQRALSFFGPTALTDANEFTQLLTTLGVERAVAWWNAHLERTESTMILDAWWDEYVETLTGITPGTRITYERTYRRVWAPSLGGKPLDAITRGDIARVVNDLSERQEKSDKTVRNAYGIIASALKVAVRDGILTATPCVDIRLPRRTEHTTAEMRFLNYHEWAALEAVLPAHYVPLFTTLIGTGMRWGEAEALTVADVSLDGPGDPVVRITKAAKWNASKATRDIGPTKTKRSKRTVTLPPEVTVVLAPLVAGRKGSERLFLAPRGGDLRHRTVYDEWKAAVERAGLDPQPRIHDLRHSHVAWLIAAGVPLPVIQARLGHESIKTTVDRYGHLLPDLQRAAADAASLAMRGATPRPAVASGTPALPGGAMTT